MDKEEKKFMLAGILTCAIAILSTLLGETWNGLQFMTLWIVIAILWGIKI